MAAVDQRPNPTNATGGTIDAAKDGYEDPFISAQLSKIDHRRASHRYSAFDTHLFANYQPAASPATAKRTLESHLSETDRRLEEASKLGTALVQQRQDIAERLREVEERQEGQDLGPELRQKLAEVEKEYNELGRESARAFLSHKTRGTNPDEGQGLDALSELKGPSSPTKFSTQATDSPSKLSVPSRRQRNQPSGRVDDIEFVTQISTSLLSQVRQLQTVLAERDDALKALNAEKAKLELDAEGLSERLKTLDESEQRYKDENWSLETQTHELLAAAKENALKEQRLQQALTIASAEKNAAQRDLDDVKQAHDKLSEDYHGFRKAHDSESSTHRKNISLVEGERDALQRKIDELTSQNQELAKAVAGKFRMGPEDTVIDAGSEPDDLSLDRAETDQSPPPSPSKGAVRNSLLESETLKSSLHHAHRMIQNLKSSIHREKTEKLELKRMLQESRDELEVRRNEHGAGGSNKRLKSKPQPTSANGQPRSSHLGASRSSRIDMEFNNLDWEDQAIEGSPKAETPYRSTKTVPSGPASDSYQTATEAEDAFETANERDTGTETEAFQTGNESFAGDSSGDLTETEGGTTHNTMIKGRKVSPLPSAKRSSLVSTASTSEDEQPKEVKTPVQQPPKYRLKVGKGLRRSKIGNEEPGSSPLSLKDSPASFASNREHKGQSLFAELGDLDEDQSNDETPGASHINEGTSHSSTTVASSYEPTTEKISMVDSWMMTDPWVPSFEDQSFIPLSDQNGITDQGLVPSQKTTPAKMANLSRSDVDEKTTLEPEKIPVFGSNPLDGTYAQGGIEDPSQKQNFQALNFSPISGIDIVPSVLASESKGVAISRPSTAIQDQTGPSSDSKLTESRESVKSGVLGSVIGWATGKKQRDHEIDGREAGNQKRASVSSSHKGKIPFQELSPNVMATGASENEVTKNPAEVAVVDHGAQTALSSSQIDDLLSSKRAKAPVLGAISTVPLQSKSELPSSEIASPQSGGTLANPGAGRDTASTPRLAKRPSSASSVRPPTSDIPPLPADHRQAIAAAQQAPPREKADTKNENIMGPPMAPASAYRSTSRRPQTPNDHVPQTPASTTPRARYSTTRSTRSRRSSVSSFESELDARFNIRADGLPVPQGFDNSTDPRMIQAITQTMIGEYLWKYTRKAGRGEMSDKRHRRFFWVHPYTRTLYWSDQDPSTAGRVQLKAKSVAIEAVRVVVDDNPMPPGLHRKSIIVITPGRDVKFTATTGQRHETWFNALSYLLLRSGPDAQAGDSNHITAEDIAEFNPQFGRAAGSRVSLSSYNSRANTTRQSLTSNRGASPSKSSARRIPPTPHASSSSRLSQINHGSIGSRISSYWRPHRASATSVREGAASANTGSIYNASVVNDSAEDVRQVLERQEQESDRLENVRACCDGKHDVGSLSRRSGTVRRLTSSTRR